MSSNAQMILDEFKALPRSEQREVSQSILRFLGTPPAPQRRRKIADVAGKYHALANFEATRKCGASQLY
jgi:hypothetical protein